MMEPRQRPTRLGKDMYGGSPAVMVSCGDQHTLDTLVPTGVGCGWGYTGQVGHGDTANKLVFMLVAEERFRGAQIVMVAAGGRHSVAVGAEGRVWTWGYGEFGQLGHNDGGNRLVPTQLAGEVLGAAEMVLVTAGAVPWLCAHSGCDN